jgi:ABC-2 type transport system ATP-binding protein
MKVSSNNNNSISTSNLSKFYRNFRAVNSLTIDVSPGDIFGFLGPNGAGKTTTIRMLCGLLSPTSGYAKVAGFDIVKDSLKIRSIVGLLPESSGFYNWMSAEEYLLYFAALYKIDTHIGKKRAKDLLEKVGLATKSFVPISYYSRGMKQRLGLARTLINDPKILFLDEPTLGLDPKGQQDIQKTLLELNREKKVTIFLSSHALSEVSSLCNRVAIVNRGRLVAQGSIEDLRALAGGSSGLVVRILNSPSAEKELSSLPYRIQTNTTDNNRLIDVKVSDGVLESANDIIDRFEKAGLQIYEIRRMGMSLEDVYFKLTEAKKKEDQQTHPEAQQKPKSKEEQQPRHA